ncbi:MAG: NAD(P)H-binding protein [Spirosomataceae bacterium]
MKLQILLLGATGRTGQLLLQEAIQRNYTIHVLVRDPAKISSHPNLTIFEGSPANLPALQKAALGCEAILSTLNISRKNDFPWSKLRTPTHFLSEVIKNILQTDIQRVIVTSAWGVAETKKIFPSGFVG